MMDISQSIPKTLKNKRVTVLGMGISGMGAANLLHHLGAEVFMSDIRKFSSTHEHPVQLNKLNIPFETEVHSERVFDSDMIVVSPGIGKETEVMQKSLKKDIPIIGEMELGSWFTDAPILAITGSNGKTTTSKLLESICQTGTVHGLLAGNVGISFTQKVLEDLIQSDEKRVFILEISSFQTEFFVHFSPFISIFLNISPDHLNRHGTIENYLNAKIRLSTNQDKNSYVVYNEDDPMIKTSFENSHLHQIPFSLDPDQSFRYGLNETRIIKKNHKNFLPLDEIALIGKHNYSNIIAAATAAHLLGIKETKIAESIRNFQPIPHRMEHFHTRKGIKYINDSKATNIDAVKCALESFHKPVILILGGLYKGGNFEDLLPHTGNVSAVIAFGKAQEIITTALRDAVRLYNSDSLKKAVVLSWSIANPGDIILLSPGCASFDEFKNFEERGECFKNWVLEQD
ncbi:MAG: UDP-N-acetylmuramoyl-L-alanine--D-glutamate ligase [Candidatus Marinimicrobia bacterium]|jgi:UDP-N-acetylmuramoylalanine--D-glutamate ligase|nr:UDP-N-acetylmuramoyl-L-alanine--D-glutamate ligase [Candidatus Neomarinimicrobiota bacterium]